MLRKSVYNIDDLVNARTGLFLLEGIQHAHEKLWLWYPKDENVLKDRIISRVYNWSDCSKLPTYNGSPKFVSRYDRHELQSNLDRHEHKPHKTVLFFHAVIASTKVTDSGTFCSPPLNVSQEKTAEPNKYFSQCVSTLSWIYESLDKAALDRIHESDEESVEGKEEEEKKREVVEEEEWEVVIEEEQEQERILSMYLVFVMFIFQI